MTDPTPLAVWYEWDCQAFVDGDFIDLDVTNIVATQDMDRVPYTSATITVAGMSDEVFEAIDPRNDYEDAPIIFRIRQKADDGTGTPETIDYLPNAVALSGVDSDAWIWPRSIDRNYLTGEVTIVGGGREQLMDDQRRNSTTSFDTGVTDVLEQVQWALNQVFGGYFLTDDPILSATAIPAGDRRIINPGDTYNEFIEPELQAIDCRLYDNWGRSWAAVLRDDAPTYTGAPTTVELASYEGEPDTDPIVFEADETRTRDTDFADGVIIEFDNTAVGGTVTFQRSTPAAHTRARYITWNRPAPADDAATAVATRSRIRGREYTIRARIRFDVRPGMALTCYLPNEYLLEGVIRSVEWDIAAGEMTIRAQQGIPVE